ncbi:MAG: hypothetical protein ABW321_00715 [Polyangiales bacterium]
MQVIKLLAVLGCVTLTGLTACSDLVAVDRSKIPDDMYVRPTGGGSGGSSGASGSTPAPGGAGGAAGEGGADADAGADSDAGVD